MTEGLLQHAAAVSGNETGRRATWACIGRKQLTVKRFVADRALNLCCDDDCLADRVGWCRQEDGCRYPAGFATRAAIVAMMCPAVVLARQAEDGDSPVGQCVGRKFKKRNCRLYDGCLMGKANAQQGNGANDTHQFSHV
jgi:hypothetical protein